MDAQTHNRIARNAWMKKQALLKSARRGFVFGACLAEKTATTMLREGWVDPDKFGKELFRRMKIL